MEKFVLWCGNHDQADLDPAVQVLHRNDKEIIDFYKFNSAALLTLRLPDDIIKIHELGAKTIVQIGQLEPINGWNNFLQSFLEKDFPSLALEGNGLILIFDKQADDIEIIIEPWGRRTVYCTVSKSPIIISNEMKGIIALDRSLSSIDNLDEISLATLLGLHQSFGNRTPFKNIKLIPSGSTVRIKRNSTQPEYLYTYPYYSDYDNSKTIDEWNEYLTKRFKEIMIHEVKNRDTVGLFLSGGMDSGLLVCALPPELRVNFRCINFGNTRTTDVKRARKLVELLGGIYCFYELLPKHIMENNAFRHLWLTEGQSPSTVAFVESIAMHEPGPILTGNPGDFNLGGSWSEKLSRYGGLKGDLGHMAQNMTMRPEYFNTLLGKQKGERYLKYIKDAIIESVSYEKSNDPKVTLERFVLKNRVLRYTNFGNIPILEHKKVIEPYFLDDIISRTLQIPIQYRTNRFLQASIISALSHQASEFPWLQPKYKRLSLKTLLMSLIKKIPLVRTVGRKLLYKKLASSFEDSYVPVNTWLRSDPDYRKFVQEILFDKRTQSRGIFNIEGVKKIFEEHMSGKANHMNKLLNLIDLEIFFRLYCDGDGFNNPPKFIQNMDPPQVTKFDAKPRI